MLKSLATAALFTLALAASSVASFAEDMHHHHMMHVMHHHYHHHVMHHMMHHMMHKM